MKDSHSTMPENKKENRADIPGKSRAKKCKYCNQKIFERKIRNLWVAFDANRKTNYVFMGFSGEMETKHFLIENGCTLEGYECKKEDFDGRGCLSYGHPQHLCKAMREELGK